MKAMVLCAGLGTRLGEATREIPKPMLPLCGHPILAYILGNLKRHGFDEVVINLHFKPGIIQNHFGDGSSYGIEIFYSYEPYLLGTAGGLKNMEKYFSNEPYFLVHYGDVLTDQNLDDLLQFHRQRKALATLLVHQRPNSNSIVRLNDDRRVIDFIERPRENTLRQSGSSWVNSGVSIFSPEVLDFIPPAKPSDLPRDIFPKLVQTGKMYGYPLSGYRCAIDSQCRLVEARDAIATDRAHIHPI